MGRQERHSGGRHERQSDGETGETVMGRQERRGEGEIGRQYLWQLGNLVCADVQLLQGALVLEDIARDDTQTTMAVVKHLCLVTNLY